MKCKSKTIYENQIDISFVIPVYNTKIDELERCFRYILDIKKKKCECVVIDDGSDESKSAQYRNFCANKENVTYFRQNNSGVSSARNTGIGLAKGKYIYFCDSDDHVVSEYFDNWSILEDIDIYFTKMNLINRGQESETCYIKNTNGFLTEKQVLDAILECGFIYGPYCKLIRRNFIIENNIQFSHDMKNGEDLVFLLHMIQHSPKMFFCNEVSYKYYFDISNREKRVISDPKCCLDDNDKVDEELIKTAKKIDGIDTEELKTRLCKNKINTIFFDAANIVVLKSGGLTPTIKSMYHTAMQSIDKDLVHRLGVVMVLKYHIIRDNMWMLLIIISHIRKGYLHIKYMR